MTFKTGSWGEQAKKRSRDRTKYFVAYRKKEKKKVNARAAVHNAIKRGELVRKPCRDCGGYGQAHHSDYDKRLEVIWLCSLHHRLEHKKGGETSRP